jgi:hypothetical protein
LLLKHRKGTIHVRYQGCTVGDNIKKVPIAINANFKTASLISLNPPYPPLEKGERGGFEKGGNKGGLLLSSVSTRFMCFLYKYKSTVTKIIDVIILDIKGEPRDKQKIRK